MRIISGNLKGKSINFVKNSTTRPLKDSVKENIFNILKHSKLINVKIENSHILDLYSGIGSFGIECISRGASKVVFVEKNKNSSNILKKNITKLSIEEKTKVLNDKIDNVLNMFDNKDFDIFFLDPPFADKDFIKILNLIKNKKIFNSDHIVIIHRDVRTNDNLKNYLSEIMIKKYGRSKIIFGVFN
jgi:16S rRNA (guanine966-N2)-methyltransferase